MPSIPKPRPQPVYIFRGHTCQIHALNFYQSNLRLITADADGWIVIWSMSIRRPIAVWRAHEKSILAVQSWGDDRIITHGRDDALRVWHIPSSSEEVLSKALPAEGYDIQRTSPWLLHSVLVNTMNFCAFSACSVPQTATTSSWTTSVLSSASAPPAEQHQSTKQLLFAVPGTKDGTIHIHQLPSEHAIHIVPPSPALTKSLIMAVKLLLLSDNTTLCAITGNEAGGTSIQILSPTTSTATGKWTTIYAAQAHTQPILSLDIAPSLGRYFTSAADARIVSHPLPRTAGERFGSEEMQMVETRHAGQQSLSARLDGRVFATAGWDGMARVYSSTTLKEVAVLKWHKEGCYAVAFADVDALGAESKTSETEVENRGSVVDDRVVVAVNQARSLTVQQRREDKTRNTHWLAAGSKDGKVSLWDVF